MHLNTVLHAFFLRDEVYTKCIATVYYSITTGPGCSKLMTLLVNVSLKFQMLISQICQYFLSKKFEMLLQCKSSSHFST